MNKYHVFLSYNSSDIKFAKSIFEELRNRGIRVWFDKVEINPGDDVQARLDQGLSESQSIVILLGESLGPWQTLEVKDGIRECVYKGRPQFPILLKGADENAVPRLLRGLMYLDLREAEPYTEADMDGLAFAIKTRTQLGFNDHVGELHTFERDFLQVLLHEFSLFRSEHGVQLEVAFDHRSPTIATREARRFVRLNTPGFDKTGAKLEKRLRQVYSGERPAFNHKDEEFAFRYASGGTLPILKIDGIEYYCLFLRGLHPIGWNLANGGCNSVEELCDPTKTIMRELQEELIVVDSSNWYSFGSVGNDSFERPEFAVARDYWNQQFDKLCLLHFDQLDRRTLRVPESEGPDFLTVHFMRDRPLSYDSLFVSVSTEDYGIEVDRALVLPPLSSDGLALCDGEINAAGSVNRPVGLFRTESFDASSRLIPEFFYYTGKRNEGDVFEDIIRKLVIPDMKESNPALPEHVIPEFKKAAKEGFKLCPIARRLIPRVHAFRGQS